MAARATKVAVTLLAAALPFCMLAAMGSAPPIELDRVGLAWALPAGLALLAAAASAATIGCGS